MKKLIKVGGIVTTVILVALLAIPFFINVDKFRPKMVEAVNSKLNGTLELGKLSLSLWGRIHIGIDGLKVLDSSKKAVLSVKDASFNLPYLSVLSGAPHVTVEMKEPEITVVKDKAGKLNVMSLVKSEEAEGKGGSAPKSVKSEEDDVEVELPGIALNARFGVSIENAKLVYRDSGLDLTNTIDRLNLRIKDFSLSRKTDMELWADLKTRMGTDLELEGPLKFNLSLTPEISGGEFKSAAVKSDFSADDLLIRKGAIFVKEKGVPARLEFTAVLDSSALTLKESMVRFHNAEVLLSGVFHKDNGADFKFEARPVDLKPWSSLVPMLKEYELEGKLGLKGLFKGKPEAIQYEASIGVDALSAKGPMLKAKPVLNGSIHVITDQIDKLTIALKAPGNTLELDARVKSFSKPQITFDLTSAKGMDLDQWVEFPSPEKAQVATKQASDGGSSKEVSKDENLDALLDPLRKNEVAKGMSLDGKVSLAFVKAKGFRMDGIQAKVQMKNLVAAMSDIKLKMFDGSMGGEFSLDMKPAQPVYSMAFSVAGFDMQKAVESQFQSFRNTLTGVLSASIQGSGSSFNSLTAKRQLRMKGNFKVVNAAFRSMDIAKMANEAISGSLGKIADKVPVLKGKDLRLNPGADSKYEVVSSSFTIQNGTLEAPDFIAKAAPKRGVDLKGFTRMGLIDETIDAKWELTDTQRVTGADQLSVNVAGKNIQNFLAKSEKDPVTLPITVGCKWSAPCMNYGQVPEYLAGVAANRLSNVAKDVVKQKVQDSVKGAIEKGVGNAIKGLFGR